MHTSVTFKNLEPSDHLRAYVSDKLNRFDKYLDNPAEANVVLSIEKFRHCAEITINGDRLVINGKEETNDMYPAIDMVLDKLESQIKRSKAKIRNKRGSAKAKSSRQMTHTEAAEGDDQPPQIVIKNIEYKPMDVEEAALQMNLVDDAFLVFTNARTNRVNVLYRRTDGNYGLIQPA